jgi:hypothetical protein
MDSTATQLVSEAIAPSITALREIGFRGSKRTFYRVSDDRSVIFHVESSRWNARQFASFTIRLGAYIPEVAKKLRMVVLASPPKSLQGCVWTPDIGRYMSKKYQRSDWWNIPQDFSVSEAGADLLHITKTIAIPWFERTTTVDGFCESVLQYGTLVGADRLWRLGRKHEAHKCARSELEITTERFEGKKYAKVVREWLRAHPLEASSR